MNKPRVCAITGSNGYVGSCVKNYFNANGWRTLDLARRTEPGGIAFHLGESISPPSLSEVHTLVHCAYDLKLLRWKEIYSVNVLGTKKLFEAARTAGVQKIINISTISAFDGCRSLYGRAKLEIEKIALAHNALSIRPGLVYGDNPGGMVGKLVAQVRHSSIIPLIGGGLQKNFMVHQKDLSAFIANYAASEIKSFPPLLTAAHPQPLSFRQLLLEIAGSLNKKIKFVPVPWQFVWAGLKAAELCGLKMNFRSDSLIGMVYQNTMPDFSQNASVGLICRPFESEKVRL